MRQRWNFLNFKLKIDLIMIDNTFIILNIQHNELKDMSKIIERTINPKDVSLFPTTSTILPVNDPSKLIEYLDLTFLLDITGSMGSYIQMAKDKIKSMIASLEMVMQLKLMNDRGKIDFNVVTRVSLIGYRDFGDSKQFEYLPLTANIDDVYSSLASISVSGGGDTPEDILGAFLLFFDKMIDPIDPQHTTKILILMADAPGHGKFMNGGNSDSHIKEGDEELWKKCLTRMKENKIEFICVQLTESMNQMVSFFKDNYDDHNYNIGIVKITSGNTEKVADELTACTSEYCVKSINKR